MTTLLRMAKQKREEIKVTYRVVPDVKSAILRTSEGANRSENLQAEYLIKLGLLAIAGIDTTKMTAGQITDKFAEIYGN